MFVISRINFNTTELWVINSQQTGEKLLKVVLM